QHKQHRRFVWGQSLARWQDLPRVTEWGWVKEDGKVSPNWITVPDASNACQELIKCGCKQKCSTRCKCKTFRLECTELCNYKKCIGRLGPSMFVKLWESHEHSMVDWKRTGTKFARPKIYFRRDLVLGSRPYLFKHLKLYNTAKFHTVNSLLIYDTTTHHVLIHILLLFQKHFYRKTNNFILFFKQFTVLPSCMRQNVNFEYFLKLSIIFTTNAKSRGVTVTCINPSSTTLNFDQNKSRQKFHHSLKEHHKIIILDYKREIDSLKGYWAVNFPFTCLDQNLVYYASGQLCYSFDDGANLKLLNGVHGQKTTFHEFLLRVGTFCCYLNFRGVSREQGLSTRAASGSLESRKQSQYTICFYFHKIIDIVSFESDMTSYHLYAPFDVIHDVYKTTHTIDHGSRPLSYPLFETKLNYLQVLDIPLTVKMRTGVHDKKWNALQLVPQLRNWGASLVTLHGRSREQRYTKSADWGYINQCVNAASPMPLFGNGDVLSFEDVERHRQETGVSGVMIARGALIKPWIFTEIKEQRHWDISSSERLDIIKEYVNYGLEHWGSDSEVLKNDIVHLKMELEKDVSQLKAGLESDITHLKTGLKTNVTQLENEDTELKSDITKLKADKTRLEDNISGMKKVIDNINDTLHSLLTMEDISV
ncbi:tRNA-dihydrouridine(47) synthase [NAD(P)(+)]-like isoform X2, partial [Paramuricea clavata]